MLKHCEKLKYLILFYFIYFYLSLFFLILVTATKSANQQVKVNQQINAV